MAVIKTIDLVGVSTESWRDAAAQALAEYLKGDGDRAGAAKTISENYRRMIDVYSSASS